MNNSMPDPSQADGVLPRRRPTASSGTSQANGNPAKNGAL